MNKKPLVSICIPVFNSEKYIEEALNSALNQTYDNIEIIVVDNNSTDNTKLILKKYKNYQKVKLYKNKKNIGMYANFNKTIEHANGKYLKFLCADDIINDECVKEMTKVIEKYDNIEIVTALDVHIDETGNIIKENHPLKKEGIYFGKNIIKKMYRKVTGSYCNSPSHVLIRNKKNLRFYDINKSGWANDTVMWMKLLTEGDLYFLKKRIVFNRRHAKNNHKKTKKKNAQYREYLKAFYKFKNKDSQNLYYWDDLIMKNRLVYNILCDNNLNNNDIKKILKKEGLKKYIPSAYLLKGINLIKNLLQYILFKNINRE